MAQNSKTNRGSNALIAPTMLPAIGARLTLESTLSPGRHWSQLVGFKAQAYVLVETPESVSQEAMRGPFWEDDSLTVRYVRDGVVVGFRAAVLGRVRAPVSMLVLAYPSEAQTHALREHPRMSCNLPCVVWIGGRDMRRAMLRDVSEQGYQVRVALADLGAPDPLVAETVIELEVEMPDPTGRSHRAQRFTGHVVGVKVQQSFALVRVRSRDPLGALLEYLGAFTAQLS